MLSLLAQNDVSATSTMLEFDWPYTLGDWGLVFMLFSWCLFTIWINYRDAQKLSTLWMIWLTGLRLATLLVLFIIALNPHLRQQKEVYRPSHVALLVDTSTSMQQPEVDPRTNSGNARTRMEAVRDLLKDSHLVDELRKQHVIDVYTFDSDLSTVKAQIPSTFVPDESATTESAPAEKVDWDAILETAGNATNLGDSLDRLLSEIRSPTLSGVVIFSDGARNAGREVRIARDRAQDNGARLVTVGVGSTTPPVNLEIPKVAMPTDVQKGDLFEVTAYLQGDGIAEKKVLVELLEKATGESEPRVVERQEQAAPEDGELFEVTFSRNPSEPGEYEYTLRATVPGVVETREDDNEEVRTVNIFDRPLKVLMIAGGPMRDYRYARTILHRHPSLEVDVWLQTGGVGSSQESHQLLYRFPETREEVFQYDLLIAFDADWSQVTPEQQQQILEWVNNEGGGVILMAGDVNTPQLAAKPDDYETLLKLYPVLLDAVGLRLGSRDEATTAYHVGLTQEGQAAEFLKLDESGDSDPWKDFSGVYGCYPTRGVKAGTTVYAEFTDPLSRGAGGQPVMLGTQKYGQGTVLYIGSPELWRLRSLNPAFLDRFWTKLCRKAAEGRSKRGLQRAMFILEGRDYNVRQTIPLRVRAVNSKFEPLDADTMTVEVYTPSGRPLVPALTLRRDQHRPAEYTGDLRPADPGRYRLEFGLPDSTETVTAEIHVGISKLEAASLVQDVDTLTSLARDTGGKYITLAAAAAEIPALLPNKGERSIIDEQIQEKWDHFAIILLLVFFLSAEWLTRKLLKLA